MNDSTMLILVGGRSAVPTISGVIQFLDDINRIKFLVCEGEQSENLQRIIAKFIKDRNNNVNFEPESDVKIVNPADFAQISKSLTELLAGEKKISFASLASAPQTLSIASYAFLQREFPDATIFTVSTDRAVIIPLQENKDTIPFRKKLNVEDYILACGHTIYARKAEKSFTFQKQEQLKELVFFFAENVESVDPILTEIREQAGRGSNSIKSFRNISLSEEFMAKHNLVKPFIVDFLERLEAKFLIEKLNVSPQEVSFRVDPSSYSFLQGDWLELFVFLQARKCGFDSLEPSIEISGYNGEIDLFCLHNSNPLVCECKTGKFDKKAIFKLRNIVEKLGESYCIKVLVTSAMEVSDKLKKEAENSKLKILKGRDLTDLSDLLKQEMNDPQYKRR